MLSDACQPALSTSHVPALPPNSKVNKYSFTNALNTGTGESKARDILVFPDHPRSSIPADKLWDHLVSLQKTSSFASPVKKRKISDDVSLVSRQFGSLSLRNPPSLADHFKKMKLDCPTEPTTPEDPKFAVLPLKTSMDGNVEPSPLVHEKSARCHAAASTHALSQ